MAGAVKSKEIRLAARPDGMPKQSDFEMGMADVGPIGDGQILVRNLWMSVDPYMRGRMMDVESYIPPFEIGKALEGGAVGEVMESRNSSFPEGSHVNSMMGWREHFVSDGAGLQAVDGNIAPLEDFLGTLGMPGLTAYAGLLRVGELKDGENVFVSAAAGAVGSVVCQIAKAKGCYVVGSAGGSEKCAWLRDEAGADRVIDYKAVGDLNAAVGEAFPKGIDVYFENVGGAHLEAALYHMRPMGRIALCGMISQYNNRAPEPGPSNLILAVGRSLKMQGFIVLQHSDMLPDFMRDMGGWIREGKVKSRKTVLEGIENAPRAFMNLFTGANFGKMLVKL